MTTTIDGDTDRETQPDTGRDRQHLLERSVRELRRMRTRLGELERASAEPIAIVGMACRMPGGARTPEEFWEFLRRGGDGITEIPASRFDAGAFYDPQPRTAGKICTRRGGFVDHVDEFDAPFFGISPREAESLDPQQRMLLEVGWEALEHAGLSPDRLAGTPAGVFVGVTTADYSQLQMQQRPADDLDAYIVMSSASTFAAGRLSYWLGITGPSLSVDTACSSSLVSVHLACQSLRAGDCSMALAGGVNLLLAPEPFIVLSQARMLAPDGTCKTFDAAADGYARGEGCAVVVLKRLSDALASGDRVLAVIRGTAVNQDGRSGGITVPNSAAQQDVVRRALRAAGVAPADVSYVEAHGTGTPLGDPIELRALAGVLGERRQGRLRVGSVKTNIGHLEAAAGVAGLLKVVLSLQHETIPPHLHLTEVNPEMSLDELGMEIPVQAVPWRRDGTPRIAGVSSFGASGTNAHVIIEEAPEPAPRPLAALPPRPAQLLTLSARTPAALAELARRHAERLGQAPPAGLPGICRTSRLGRAHFPHRLAVAGEDPAELALQLAAFAESGQAPAGVRAGYAAPGAAPRVAFLFTGQGSEYAWMAREADATEPVFRLALDACDEVLAPLLRRSLRSVIDPEAGESELIRETRYTQPALLAVEYALAQLWRSWGIEPAAVLGHSAGELAAATVAGVMSLPDGLALAAERGRLMHELPDDGVMASVFASLEEVTRALEPFAGEVCVAAVNGPAQIVISGPRPRVAAALEAMTARGLRTRALSAARAFHSQLIDPMLDGLEAAAARITFAEPSIPLISNLTGAPLEGTYTPRYLRDHARLPVQFRAGAQALLAAGVTALVEVGPQPTLLAMARRIAAAQGRDPLCLAPSLRPGQPDGRVLADSLGALYAHGCAVDWAALDAGRESALADLPLYPFQRERHWFRAAPPRPAARTADTGPAEAGPAEAGPAGLLGRRVPSPLAAAQYAGRLRTDEHRCLGDCVIDGLVVANIGVYLETALAAAAELGGGGPAALTEVLLLQSLVLEPGASRAVQAVTEDLGDGQAAFQYYAEHPDGAAAGGWLRHAQARLRPGAAPGRPADATPPAAAAGRLAAQLSGAEFYHRMWRRKLYLGPSAQWVEHVWHGPGEAVARMRDPQPGEAEPYRLHPGLTDAMFQLLFACLPADAPADAAYMLVSIDEFAFRGRAGTGPLYCRATLSPASDLGSLLIADCVLQEASGRVVAQASGACLKRAERSAVLGARPAAPAAALARPAAAPARPAAPAAAAAPAGPDQARAAVLRTVARALGTAETALPPAEPLSSLGLDSLMALEIKDSLSGELGISLPLTALLGACSVASLTGTVLDLLGPAGGERPGGPADRGPAPAADPEPAPAPRAVAAAGLAGDPAGRHEPFPLSDLQQAYLVGRGEGFELGGVSTYFFIETDLEGTDLARLESSLNEMIRRHDMLRAVITPDGSQRVLPEVPRYEIAAADLSGATPAERAAYLVAVHEEMRGQVLDPAAWPMFDIRATRLSPSMTRLHIGLDALIIDAWSTSVLFSDWAAAYRGDAGELAELTVSYRDYQLAVAAQSGSVEHRRAQAYWAARLDSLPPAPGLPLAASPAQAGRPEFTHRSERLPAAEWAAFKAHAATAGVTPSAAVCAAYAQVLAAWSRSPDFTLNLLYFNRRPLHPQVRDVVGNFSATSLLEVHAGAGQPFAACADAIHQQLWADLEHSAVSGVQVLRDLNQARGSMGQATMPVVFASTVPFGSRSDAPAAAGLAQHLMSMGTGGREVATSIRTPQVWLDHQVIEDQGELVVNWDVVEALFPPRMIDLMFAAYLGLLRSLCAGPAAWQQPAGVLVPAEDLAARQEANATAGPAADGLLHDGFDAMAAAEPGRPAVIAAGRTLSYGELDQAADDAARLARSLGAGSGDLVGIVMEKGWEQVAAAIGILRAGAAYVPIDAAIPPGRLELLLGSAGISAVLTQPGVAERVEWPAGVAVRCIGEPAGPGQDPVPACPATPGDLAYVIFTSGSTGVPKGVMVEHAAAVNTIRDINDRMGLTSDDRVITLSALNFDLSVFDIFGALAAGAAIVMPEPSAHREPARWAALAAEHGVTVWNSVPTLMEMFTEHALASGLAGQLPLRVVMMSGDWIPVTLPDRIRDLAPGAAVWSLGGATEAAIWSIAYLIEKVDPAWASIPYGTPLRNQEFHILSDALAPCPTWVPGQLYIGGAGLARGYLNDPAKTQAAFITHPVTGQRLYRTGDLGRYRPDGTIEFLGREDFQVKIQGYRIELGEVEAGLLRCAGVRAAVASAAGTPGSRQLIAHVVTDAGSAADRDAILAELRGQLPGYLVPQHLVLLDELPLTANGKLNRAALPGPDASAVADATPPRDATEAALAAVWEEFFPVRPLGIRRSYFELGGDSLMAVRLMAAIRRVLGRSLPLSALFERPTIELLARALRDEDLADGRRALVPVRPAGTRPPLVLVHPVGGDVLCYAGLSAGLDGDQPLYALQVPDAAEPPATIEDIAACYVRALAPLGAGPWRIGGWSMGGIVALEMARQLRRSGAEVELVALVDLLEPPGAAGGDLDDAALVSWLAHDLAGLAGQDWELPADKLRAGGLDTGGRAPLEVLHDEAQAAGVLPADIDLPTLEAIFGRFARNARAMAAHQPEPYDGRARFFRAAGGGASAETAAAWLALLTGDATVTDVPGDHYTIMTAPHVAVLADNLGAALRGV